MLSDNAVEVTYKNSNYNSYSGDITIPETITCKNITYSVTSIGGYAFLYCSELTSVSIPNSVTSVGESAFSGCYLTSIHIGENVSKIGSRAFYANNIKEITVSAAVPPITDSDMFDSSAYTKATLRVPKKSIEAYKTTEPWSNFSNIK